MGASQFLNRAVAKTADEAFRKLGGCSASDIYAGDITCKPSYRMVEPKHGETPADCLRRLENDADHFQYNKWGPAACIDLGPASQLEGHRIWCFFGWAAS